MFVRNKRQYATYKAETDTNVYTSFIFGFAERWADKMEAYLDQGVRNMEKLVDSTFNQASTHVGIKPIYLTPRMIEEGKKILCKYWEHGEMLKDYLENKH